MIADSTREFLGQDFFKEEERCGFLVTEKMKHIWATELDLYLQFVRVCEKYKLKHYLVWGSLLGAVRHKGFIPWDDDMDVALPREDYEIFLRVAPQEFSAPYFLQTPYSDIGSYFSITRLRNSSTTGMIKTFKHNKFNQGIWLDIDVIDYCDINKIEEDRAKIYESIMKCASYMRRGSKYLDEKRKVEIQKFYTDSPLLEFENIQRIASDPAYKGSQYVNIATTSAYPPNKQVWPTSSFANSIEVPFEGIRAKIPSGYDIILSKTYGDYMQFPPAEKRTLWHSGNLFDPWKPYSLYIDE